MEAIKVIKEKMLKESEDTLNGLSIMEYILKYTDSAEITNEDIM